MPDKKYAVCLMCANVYEFDSELVLRCPQCGYVLSASEYFLLLDYSNDVLHFGFNYRKSYQAQVDEHDEIVCHFALVEPGVVDCILNIPIVLWAIHGFSYDLCKKSFLKIKEKLCEYCEDDVINSVYFKDSFDFDYAMDSAIHYRNGFTELNDKVRNAIVEEFMAHAMEKVPLEQMVDLVKHDQDGKYDISDLCGVGLESEQFKVAFQKYRKRERKVDSILQGKKVLRNIEEIKNN